MISRRPSRIALLTPYTGGNLGDAAIQEATIASIRARQPRAEIVGITLCPARTATAHGIQCFPLSRQPCPQEGMPHAKPDEPAPAPSSAPFASLRAVSRRYPSLSLVPKRFISLLRLLLRGFARGISAVSGEAVHLVRAWQLARGVGMIVAAGGGQLDEYWGGPWGQPYALAKWALLARVTGSRFAFLSIGTCALESRVSRSFIRVALRMAVYRSYRDETSKRLLAHLAFTRHDPVFPDLAFSHPAARPYPAPDPASGRGRIGVSPIAYLSRHSWPRRQPAVYERYIVELTRFIERLCDRGYEIRLFVTNDCDLGAVEDVSRLLGGRLRADGPTVAPHAGLAGLLCEIEAMELVVASRLHGIVLSHLHRKPVLALSYDRKVDTYMSDSAMSGYCRDIHNFDADSLLRGVVELEAERDSVRCQLDAWVRTSRETLGSQYDTLFGRVDDETGGATGLD